MKIKWMIIISIIVSLMAAGCGNDPAITLKEFEKIEKGMTAKKVEKIIGGAEYATCEQAWIGESMYTCVYVDEYYGNAFVYYDSNWEVVEMFQEGLE